MASVSVVIPCYRYGNFLQQAVASVLEGQEGVDVRVLIIDDASPDDSAEVAQKIAADDDRVEVIVHESNKGHIATYNEGLLEWADGDYSVLMSADDRLTPGAMARAVDLLDAHPEVGFVYGRPLWFWEDKPFPTPRTRVRGWSVWPGAWWIERRLRQGENCITAPEVVVRTSVQKRVGGYDPRLPHAGDLDMWLRLAEHGQVGFLHGVDQAYYRVHGRNMRTGYDALGDLRQKRLAFELALARSGGELSDARALSDRVHRKLSRDALWFAAHALDLGQTDMTAVDELVAFAFDCWPRTATLPVYRTLQLRRRVGPRAVTALQPLLVTPLARRAGGWLQRQSWKYRGF
jgi:glycosyltransferase involved in cell wall biosynthesis